MSSSPAASIRDKVTETIKTLPDDASWDDVMYRIYVRQKIENGLKDVTEGNIRPKCTISPARDSGRLTCYTYDSLNSLETPEWFARQTSLIYLSTTSFS